VAGSEVSEIRLQEARTDLMKRRRIGFMRIFFET